MAKRCLKLEILEVFSVPNLTVSRICVFVIFSCICVGVFSTKLSIIVMFSLSLSSTNFLTNQHLVPEKDIEKLYKSSGKGVRWCVRRSQVCGTATFRNEENQSNGNSSPNLDGMNEGVV